MGHYCRICGRSRPNERFSGKGHRIHVCKACQRLPKAEREYIEIMDELSGFLEQSNISRKNVIRLTELCEYSNLKVRDRASLILEIARVKPHKRLAHPNCLGPSTGASQALPAAVLFLRDQLRADSQ